MNEIGLKAYGKINLALDVVRKREDGYHEVRMIMQTVKMYDYIKIKKSKEKGIRVYTNLSFLPTDENNLVYKAAKLLMDEFNIEQGIEIKLDKFIPVAAGMGGGSSDAATVMIGINKMFELGLKKNELMDRGVKIGADVPYCILRGTCLAEGIGEKLTTLKPMPNCYVVVIKPSISVSTKFVYENLRANELTYHPDIDGMIADIGAGDLHAVAGKLGNVLETVTQEEYPVIGEIKRSLINDGAINALMSGSGPTVFGLFEDKDVAENALQNVKSSGLGKQFFVTEMYNIDRR
ncbi:MAG: 4-(cytidine 5'-diphospho)-2-C-methyl-D-erythritol kinase [Lachnospiraceae bacterium]|nr:4-(cytidine 5'-diphospho)-2-C-methyl-D-erythritol kinase [Lachnospiraceae bacterium]MBQ4069265.1 4-(cytidine 5'-diphospho)-2-C-methyl-D-erythritol kinase [Lachnospiraceae bacterium]